MPYVFPAADLLLANKFYLRSLIREVIQKMETFSVRGRRGEGVLSSIKVFSFFFSLKTIQNLSLTAKTCFAHSLSFILRTECFFYWSALKMTKRHTLRKF